jgi:hypothetical protein
MPFIPRVTELACAELARRHGWPSAYVPRTKVDAAGTSNSPNGCLTRQKLSLFQWLVLPQWFPTDKDSVPTDSGIPFECFLNPADRLEPGARSVNS